jgi:hypothetical protein
MIVENAKVELWSEWSCIGVVLLVIKVPFQSLLAEQSASLPVSC